MVSLYATNILCRYGRLDDCLWTGLQHDVRAELVPSFIPFDQRIPWAVLPFPIVRAKARSFSLHAVYRSAPRTVTRFWFRFFFICRSCLPAVGCHLSRHSYRLYSFSAARSATAWISGTVNLADNVAFSLLTTRDSCGPAAWTSIILLIISLVLHFLLLLLVAFVLLRYLYCCAHVPADAPAGWALAAAVRIRRVLRCAVLGIAAPPLHYARAAAFTHALLRHCAKYRLLAFAPDNAPPSLHLTPALFTSLIRRKDI